MLQEILERLGQGRRIKGLKLSYRLVQGMALAGTIAALLICSQRCSAYPRAYPPVALSSLPRSPALEMAHFPLGFYYVDYDLEPQAESVRTGQLAALQAIAEAGFNTVHLAVYDELEVTQAVLDQAQALGLRVMVDYQSDLSRSTVVTQLKDSPGILSWAIGDDVNVTLTPQQLRAAGAEVKAADGDRPTYISMFDPDPAVIRPYLDSADWVGMQSYPLGDRPLRATFDEIHSLVETAEDFGPGRPSVLANLQAFAWPPEEPNQPPRIPTGSEVRNMTFQALAAGAEGILYYTYRDADWYLPAQAELWQSMARLVPEVGAIEPWLRAGGRTVRRLGPHLIVATWEGGDPAELGEANRPLLMVINTGYEPLPVEFDLGEFGLGDFPGAGALLGRLAKPSVPFPGAPVSFQPGPSPRSLRLRPDGRVVGTLAPLDVHLYQRQP